MLSQCKQGGVICHITTREQQSTFFLMQRCKLLFKSFVHHWISRNVSGATSSNSMFFNRFTIKIDVEKRESYKCNNYPNVNPELKTFISYDIHLPDGCFNFWMSRHSKVIITTPNIDIFFSPAEFFCSWKIFRRSIHFFEDTVGMVQFLLHDLLGEEIFIIIDSAY